MKYYLWKCSGHWPTFLYRRAPGQLNWFFWADDTQSWTASAFIPGPEIPSVLTPVTMEEARTFCPEALTTIAGPPSKEVAMIVNRETREAHIMDLEATGIFMWGRDINNYQYFKGTEVKIEVADIDAFRDAFINAK